MKTAIIHDLPNWQVTSYGNGLAYEIVNKETSRCLFFQGDDADIFRDSLSALTDKRPSLSYSDALECIWSDYNECAYGSGSNRHDI